MESNNRTTLSPSSILSLATIDSHCFYDFIFRGLISRTISQRSLLKMVFLELQNGDYPDETSISDLR
jgi:hypothetical protein